MTGVTKQYVDAQAKLHSRIYWDEVLGIWREAVDLKSVPYEELTSGKYAYLGLDGKCRGYCIIMNERDKNYVSVVFFTGSGDTSYPVVDKDKYDDFDCFIRYEA